MENVVEVRQRARVHILILLRILAGIRVLHRPAERLRLENDPVAIALFEIVCNLHPRAGRSARLGPELDFRMSLASADGDTTNIHIHSGYVERSHTGEVLQDRGADGVVIARPSLASGSRKKGSNEPYNEGKPFHAQFLSGVGDRDKRRSSFRRFFPMRTVYR